jgi:ribonuclease BN (tRNA processing enzyme)
MYLTVVGSGTAAPHPSRVGAAHWIEAGDARLLLDCGSGAVHRLAALGVAWPSVTHVALSHFHIDHVGDLAALIAALRWGQLPPRHEPLVIVGPVGTDAWLTRLAAAHGDWVRGPGYDLVVQELPTGTTFELAPGVALSVRAVPHTPQSVAYSIASGRARLVYTGDTAYDEGLAAWAAGCDVLLAECSLPSSLAIPEHLTPETAGALAARANPGRLLLTHFYPPVEREDIAAIVATHWSGSVTLARDGTSLEIEE